MTRGTGRSPAEWTLRSTRVALLMVEKDYTLNRKGRRGSKFSEEKEKNVELGLQRNDAAGPWKGTPSVAGKGEEGTGG